MTSILERLAIGDLKDLEQPQEGVNFILNVAEEVEVSHPHLHYHKIPLKDGFPIPVEKMKEAISWIKRHIASGKVLVACHWGVGRSASVIIGYLCNLGFGYEEALEFVSSKKPGINPIPRLKETITNLNHQRGDS
ncbi:MAG: dual specificity protein phosphatase family protein [Thermodesulfobacteriota bacterium]